MSMPKPNKVLTMRTHTIMFVLLTAAGLCLALSACGLDRPKAHFRLEPNVVSACDLPVATRVIWDVTALGLKYVRFEVSELGGRPKHWMVGNAAGQLEAGAWADDGYTVTLKSMNGVVLARRTLTTIPCKETE